MVSTFSFTMFLEFWENKVKYFQKRMRDKDTFLIWRNEFWGQTFKKTNKFPYQEKHGFTAETNTEVDYPSIMVGNLDALTL